MADYETRKDDERCWSCKFFQGEPGVMQGLCTKHPRLHQKHDDPTHRTNWCQYYERRIDMITPEGVPPILQAGEERGTMNPVEEAFDKEVLKVPSEAFKDGERTRIPYEDAEQEEPMIPGKAKMVDQLAHLLAGEGPITLQIIDLAEQAYATIFPEVAVDGSPDDWVNDPLVAANVVNENIRTELATQMKELAEFQMGTERQLIAAALGNDNFAMMEMKGMIRVTAMLSTQLSRRMNDLRQEAEARDKYK